VAVRQALDAARIFFRAVIQHINRMPLTQPAGHVENSILIPVERRSGAE
jgi:hypothetical protein